MTTKTIDAGISEKHAKNWSVGEAVRELVQNWLDVRREFNCGGSISWTDGIALIKDFGPGLQLKHLAFGENDKMAGSIGQFGEGMKSAFVVLLRNGRDIEIKSGGQIIRPTLAVSEAFGITTLHYEIEPMLARHAAKLQGTAIRVTCTEEELSVGKSYFVSLVTQERKGAAKKAKKEGREIDRTDLHTNFNWVERGKISLPGGKVYVKGSFIGTIDGATFSYHLDGVSAEQATNRDRNAVDMDVVRPIIITMIAGTSSEKVIESVLNNTFTKGGQSSFESRLGIRIWNEKHARIWKRIWNQLYGDRWVTSYNSDTDRQAEYRGYKVIYNLGYDHKNLLSDIGVRSSYNFAKKTTRAKLQKVGIRSLDPVELENLKFAIRMTKTHYSDPGKVIVAESLDALMGAVGSASFVGCYQHSTGTIYICRSQLTDRQATLHTILHETVHKVSGETDETSSFERALLDVAVGMMMK